MSRIIGPIRVFKKNTEPSPQKYVTSQPNHCPLKKEYRITKLSSEFISNITHDASSPYRPRSGEGRAIKNNILEYVGNNSVSSFAWIPGLIRGHSYSDESSLLLLSRGTADVHNDFMFVISSCMNKIMFRLYYDSGSNKENCRLLRSLWMLASRLSILLHKSSEFTKRTKRTYFHLLLTYVSHNFYLQCL